MKLKHVVGTCFGLCLIFCSVFFVGCSQSITDFAKNNLSEIHYNYFTGSTEHYNISMYSGVREEPYALDGVHKPNTPFGIINVVPKDGADTFGLSYTVEINDKTYNGELESSPFDKTLAADLGFEFNDNDSIFAYIIVNGLTEICQMENISSKFGIDKDSALTTALEYFNDKITEMKDSSSIEGYCKIISSDKNLGVYFWYISFINTKNKQISCVIDAQTGEILAESK